MTLNLTALSIFPSLVEVVPPHLLTSQMIDEAIKKENGEKIVLKRLPVHLLSSKMIVDAINKAKITRFAEIPDSFQTDNVVKHAFFNKNRVLQEDIPGLTAEFITKYDLWYHNISLLKTKTPEIMLALVKVSFTNATPTILKELFMAIPDEYWTEEFASEIFPLGELSIRFCTPFDKTFCCNLPDRIRQYPCWIKRFGIKYTDNPTESQVILAVSEGPQTLSEIDVSFWTPAVLRAAVISKPLGTMMENGFAERQTPELVQIAVFRSPWVIRFVREDLRTPELLDVAFELVAAGYDSAWYKDQNSDPLRFAEETGNRVLSDKLAKLKQLPN